MKKNKFERSLLNEKAKSQSVLFIESHAGTRFKLSKILKEYYKEVQVCLYAEGALKKFQTQKFDLVVIDSHLDGLESFIVCEKIREITTKKPIVMVSHTKNGDDLIKFINLGINGFITLPLNEDEIISILARISNDISDMNILYEYIDINVLLENEKKKLIPIEEEQNLPVESVDSLFIDLNSMSAKELNEAYPIDLGIIGDKLFEISDEIEVNLNKFLIKASPENAYKVSLSFEKFSITLENISLFSNIVVATKKLSYVFEKINCSKSYEEYGDILDLISSGLNKWVDQIFISQSMENIYYMDKSILADSLTIEKMLLNIEEETNEIEFF